jgi:hypothetical protein
MESNKSRSLTVYQFFQMLQVEWLVADLRSRIYPKAKDKEYWNKVKEGKKKKIEGIADKNHLPTIFTDEEMKRIFELKIYNDKGIANFHYKDEAQREAQEPLDLTYYYSKGTEVRFDIFGEQKIGIVKSYLPYKETLTVMEPIEVVKYLVPTREVTRIL